MEPAGVTAHPDHMAVSAATQAAFGAYAAGPREREPRLYYWGAPVSDMTGWRTLGQASGFELPGADDPYGTKGTPDEQFTCTVDTSAVAEQAWRALCQHRTQAGDVWYRLSATRRTGGRCSKLPPHPRPPGPPPRLPARDFPGGGVRYG